MINASTLDVIGLKHGTDKASSGHNYLEFYESFFAPLRENQLTVLEIGVYQGASLKTGSSAIPSFFRGQNTTQGWRFAVTTLV
jgi:hypothetical protein